MNYNDNIDQERNSEGFDQFYLRPVLNLRTFRFPLVEIYLFFKELLMLVSPNWLVVRMMVIGTDPKQKIYYN